MPKRKVAKRKTRSKSLAHQLLTIPKDRRVGDLADWLEVSAWAQTDAKISRAEVVAPFSFEEDSTVADEIIDQIWDEIRTRALHLGDKYPFELSPDEQIFSFKGDDAGANPTPYLICLLISYLGLPAFSSSKTTQGSFLFEKLCTHSAKQYLSDPYCKANGLQFGSPRKDWKKKVKKFPQAVDELILSIGDGENRVSSVRNTTKVVGDGGDGGLDVVAWRPFIDNKRGCLLLFGQCATSRSKDDYMSKVGELNTFLQENLTSDFPVIFGFFLPHSLTHNDDDHKNSWERIKRQKNIPFDRNRIVFYGGDWENLEANKLLKSWRKKIKDDYKLV